MAASPTFGNDLYTGERSIDFVGRQQPGTRSRGVLIVLAAVGLLGRGLNLGLEFKGGSEFRVRDVTTPATSRTAARRRSGRRGGAASRSPSRHRHDPGPDRGSPTPTSQDVAQAELAKAYGVPEDESASTSSARAGAPGHQEGAAGPGRLPVLVVAGHLGRTSAPGRWRVAAIIALLHDLFITVGIYALVGFEVTPATVIGFLTILGYSLYDTVVVFDKVRENTRGIVAQQRVHLRARPPTWRSTRPWSARSTPRSSPCCRSPRSWSSARSSSAPAR